MSELETARRLLFLVEADLTKLTRHRERNSFRVREKVIDRDTEGFRGELAGPETVLDWFDGQLALAPRRGRGSSRVREQALTGQAPPSLPDSFVAGERWSLVVARAWKSAAKIHEYEVWGELLGLKRAAQDLRCHDTVLLSASDNMSSVCAYEKGRAANWELLAQCRRAAAHTGCQRHRLEAAACGRRSQRSRLHEPGRRSRRTAARPDPLGRRGPQKGRRRSS